MKQVLANLISTAVTVEKAIIEVGQMTVQGRVVFFVRDNGVGLDMKSAVKLFAPFQRLHQEQDFEGTGIGLATVQRILEKHRGHIWAESEPRRGSTFFFTVSGEKIALPANQEDRAVPAYLVNYRLAVAETRTDKRAGAPLNFVQVLRSSSARPMTRSITSCDASPGPSASAELPCAGISRICSFSMTGFMARAGLRRKSELRMRVKIQPMRSSTDCRSISSGSFSSG